MMKSAKDKKLFFSTQVPVLQNRVYSDKNVAKKAKSGCLDIVLDDEMGFAFNASFLENCVHYDRDYDNSVPSAIFMDYYDRIADYLVKQHDLRKGIVIDIGCGKGTFLSRFAGRYDFVRGIGIDPSYVGPPMAYSGRLKFVTEYFSQDHLSEDQIPALVLCRHVLEHIPSPVDFLKTIFAPFLQRQEEIPVFIEVPDLTWIIQKRAFWDFCYEHVNYFTRKSLAQCIEQAGGYISRVSSAFGDQYLWAEASLNASDRSQAENDYMVNTSERFRSQKWSQVCLNLKQHLELVRERIRTLSLAKKIVIWGMSTKGVMYSLELINSGVNVSYCVDINEQKQGKYAPLSGLKIVAPSDLDVDNDYAIVCMNPNYAIEIASLCYELGLKGMLLTPDGEAFNSL